MNDIRDTGVNAVQLTREWRR